MSSASSASEVVALFERWQIDVHRVREQVYRAATPRERERWQRIVAAVLDDVADGEGCFRELWQHFGRPEAWRTIASFGDWVEQLVAESTGKSGKGILPVVGEPLEDPGRYAEDRLFVALLLAVWRRPRRRSGFAWSPRRTG